MKITGVEVLLHRFPLVEPYTIATGTYVDAPNVFAIVKTDGPHTGMGCVSPDKAVTGESAEETVSCIADLEGALIGEDPLRRGHLRERIRDAYPKRPAVRAAIDLALYDLLARCADAPLWRVLGGYRSSIPTSVTIGIHSVEATTSRALAWVERGFTVLKIKGGENVREDIERVIKVREAVGSNVELRFDANQGYDADTAIYFVREAARAELELIEQPTSRGSATQLATVTRAVSLPVMADESLHDLNDTFRLARGDIVDMVNLKLVKLGGIGDAMHCDSVARAAGLETMVGCMDECAAGIAASLAFALSRQNVRYADLDAHLDIVDDPTAVAVRVDKGVLYPSDSPGIGVEPSALDG